MISLVSSKDRLEVGKQQAALSYVRGAERELSATLVKPYMHISCIGLWLDTYLPRCLHADQARALAG